jgi:hypothetical protein
MKLELKTTGRLISEPTRLFWQWRLDKYFFRAMSNDYASALGKDMLQAGGKPCAV